MLDHVQGGTGWVVGMSKAAGNDEGDAILNRAADRMDQVGGGLKMPLFEFNFKQVGPRKRWRNIVRGQRFH